MDVFWKQGYEATSLADLTKAMGINPPSLYAAFGDKEHLFLEAVEHYSQCRASMACIFDEEPTARGAIERLLTGGAADLAKSGHDRGCMLINSATNCSNPAVQAALAKRRGASKALIKSRIDRGVRDGDVPPGTDTAALADFYTSVMWGMSMQARDGASKKSLLATAQAAMRAWPESPTRAARSARRTAAVA